MRGSSCMHESKNEDCRIIWFRLQLGQHVWKVWELRGCLQPVDKLSASNVAAWNAILAGYAQQEMGQEARVLDRIMQLEGLASPNSVTYVCLLQACASLGVGALHQGKQLISERGLHDDVVLGSSLVNMYAKCGSLQDACRVRLLARNVVTWTAMIAWYCRCPAKVNEETLGLYSSMELEGLTPNSVTYASLMQACAQL